ncbi:hypothetical protein [Methyloglobulus sp.]|uniref:hypothetical protein n=1 Tax=Methyloglobulus sp. TaxID=2518622 RepID=UPI003989E0FB
MMKKTNNILAIALLVNACFACFAWAESGQVEERVNIVVHRSPSCSCCGKWVEHLKQNNFNVNDVVSDDVQAIKINTALLRKWPHAILPSLTAMSLKDMHPLATLGRF